MPLRSCWTLFEIMKRFFCSRLRKWEEDLEIFRMTRRLDKLERKGKKIMWRRGIFLDTSRVTLSWLLYLYSSMHFLPITHIAIVLPFLNALQSPTSFSLLIQGAWSSRWWCCCSICPHHALALVPDSPPSSGFLLQNLLRTMWIHIMHDHVIYCICVHREEVLHALR